MAEMIRGRRSGYLLKFYFFFNDSDGPNYGVSIHKYFEISETVGGDGLVDFYRSEPFILQDGLDNFYPVLLRVFIYGLPVTHRFGIASGIGIGEKQ